MEELASLSKTVWLKTTNSAFIVTKRWPHSGLVIDRRIIVCHRVDILILALHRLGHCGFLVFERTSWLATIREPAEGLGFWFVKSWFRHMVKYAFLFVFTCLVELTKHMVKSAAPLGQPIWAFFLKFAKRLLFIVHI